MERHVRAEDWAESWKAFFDVEHVGARIVIRPSWREYLPRPDDVVLDLDPGMAFGTGQHPTTRLCLAALEGFLRPGMAVLDLGCGSGILSVAAVKLGCSQVWALDIEQVAVEATLANIARNAAAPQVHCALGSLGEPWPFADPARGIADLAVANISAAVLVNLAVPIVEALRPDGVLIGSGIIAERLDEVLVAFAAAGLSSQDIHADGDWRAVIARRPA
jgi:ribosomal protein L11 methyltransferase